MDAHHLAHIVQRSPLRQLELEFQEAVNRLLCQGFFSHLDAHTNRPGVSGLLQGGGLLDGDDHTRIKLFPHARYRKQEVRRNLSHVFGDGFGILHKIEQTTCVDRGVFTNYTFRNMAQGQETHAFVVVGLRQTGCRLLCRKHQAAVALHGPFGFASSARGVNQDRKVLRTAHFGALVQQARVFGIEFATQLTQIIQRQDVGIVQTTQAFHVQYHHLAQLGQLVTHFQRLVQLFVVFHKQDGGGRVFAQIMHLAGGVGGVNAVGDAGAAQDGQVAKNPIDDSVGQDGRTVTRLQTQAQQAAANFADVLGGLVPGPTLPNAQFFLTHPDFVATFGNSVPENLRDGFTGGEDFVAEMRFGKRP